MKLFFNHLYTAAVATVMVMLLLQVSSCHHHERNSQYRSEQDSLRANAADSIIRVVNMTGDHDRTLALIDSFEQCGDISPIRADVRRAMVYNIKEI